MFIRRVRRQVTALRIEPDSGLWSVHTRQGEDQSPRFPRHFIASL